MPPASLLLALPLRARDPLPPGPARRLPARPCCAARPPAARPRPRGSPLSGPLHLRRADGPLQPAPGRHARRSRHRLSRPLLPPRADHRRRSCGRAAVRPRGPPARRPLLRMPGPGRRAAASKRMKGGRKERLPGAPRAQSARGKLRARGAARGGSWPGCVAWRRGCAPAGAGRSEGGVLPVRAGTCPHPAARALPLRLGARHRGEAAGPGRGRGAPGSPHRRRAAAGAPGSGRLLPAGRAGPPRMGAGCPSPIGCVRGALRPRETWRSCWDKKAQRASLVIVFSFH